MLLVRLRLRPHTYVNVLYAQGVLEEEVGAYFAD